jgi:N-acetylated-alpha-linked acidic dipeptidase
MMASAATQWRGGADEAAFLRTLNTDAPWELIHEFSNYVRESGTEGEQRAVDAITRRLTAWGIPHTVHHPRCFISLPRGATVTVSLTDGTARTLRGTTPGFAVPTGDAGITAPAVAIEAAHATSVSSIFTSGLGSALASQKVAGAIAVLNGLPMPARIGDLTAAGVAAAVFISPGTNVHEGICTPVWGTPDLDTIGAIPTLSVAEVNRSDGLWLMEQAKAGAVREVTVHTNLETRWRAIPVTVAEIRGATAPEEFVLVHGHLDSWGEGIGDNATGDATLLELARALHENRHTLARSVRVAWWSGHSHGRYAGSTWYADTFALDLIAHCVAQVNCDSPGCRWATEYRDLSYTPDLGAFTQAVIRDVAGLPAEGERPPRAGDYSFNNLGISGTLMLSSTMPHAVADEHGYYAVGGCGGNIAWHTVDDTLEIADRENLARDITVYGGVVWRLANAPILPLDLAAAGEDIKASLRGYQAALGGRFDLGEALAATDAFIAAASAFAPSASDPAAGRGANTKLLRAGRELTALNFAQRGRFRQDPALDVPPIPDLAAAVHAYRESPDESDMAGVALTALVRARNRTIWALTEAMRELS